MRVCLFRHIRKTLFIIIDTVRFVKYFIENFGGDLNDWTEKGNPVKAVAGDAVEVATVIPPGSSPES